MINEISSKSVIRRINFNKSDSGNFNEIEENFKNILKHALEISRRNKKYFWFNHRENMKKTAKKNTLKKDESSKNYIIDLNSQLVKKLINH